jgi:hypothetical protein
VHALLQQVSELYFTSLELALEVVPGQILLIKQVDQEVEHRLYVVASRLVVPSARVKRREQKIAAELIHELFSDVISMVVEVFL